MLQLLFIVVAGTFKKGMERPSRLRDAGVQAWPELARGLAA